MSKFNKEILPINSSSTELKVSPRVHNTEASTHSSEHEHDEDNGIIKELSLSQILIRSDFANASSQEQSRIILERYNQNITNSAFTDSPAVGRALERVDVSYFVLGHRNQISELFDPKGQRFSTTFSVDPTINIEYTGPILKTARYFGSFGKHVLNVPAGHYAKAISKNRPVLYGEGPHVIIDPTFVFNESTGFVNQQEPYIYHSTINILRIPAGKIAKVWVGTQPLILESRREPYVFVDAQFRLVSSSTSDSDDNEESDEMDTKKAINSLKEKIANKKFGNIGFGSSKSKDQSYPSGSSSSLLSTSTNQPFLNATKTYIQHGSIKRIIPHTGQVAITYNNGILQIIPPPRDGKPVIIDSPTHNFEGFISTRLETCLFPSKETKQQAILDNKNASSDEISLKIFQTRDSLRVGVVLVVAFKIIDPELAITKLGREGIINHIENISFADMGKAIQLSTLQEVMYFSQTKPNSAVGVDDEAHTIQDRVKSNLAKDLIEYGIELCRLQIETMKVLDLEIAKKLAGQSITSAEYTTKQASLVKEYDIKTTEAHLKAETDNIALEQKNKSMISAAQAKLASAQKESEALLIIADAERKAQEMKGELYAKFPALLELEMAKIKADALKGATIYITPQDVGNFMNSPLLFMNTMNKSNNNNSKLNQ